MLTSTMCKTLAHNIHGSIEWWPAQCLPFKYKIRQIILILQWEWINIFQSPSRQSLDIQTNNLESLPHFRCEDLIEEERPLKGRLSSNLIRKWENVFTSPQLLFNLIGSFTRLLNFEVSRSILVQSVYLKNKIK